MALTEKKTRPSGLVINKERCTRDGICVAECPARVIQLSPRDGFPAPLPEFQKYCLRCGHCVALCPEGACRLSWLSPEECLPLRPALQLTDLQAEQFLRQRRSVRVFTDIAVGRSLLERLLRMASYAPSAKNTQPWHWLVIQQPARVRRLAGLVIDWMRIVAQRDPATAKRKAYPALIAAWDQGIDLICRGAPHLIVVHTKKDWTFGSEDSANALTYLELYAAVLGLGTCWGGYLYGAANVHAPLREALHIPPQHRVCGAMMVGYPAYRYHRFPVRNQPRITWR